MKSTRIEAGHYLATWNGHRIEAIHHSVYGGRGNLWNLVIDGVCDDAYVTKREAIESGVEFIENRDAEAARCPA